MQFEPSKVSWAVARFVRRPPPWAARVFVYFVWAFLLAAGVYSYFSTVPVVVESRGGLVFNKNVYPVLIHGNVKVNKPLVKLYQKVKKGEPLMQLELLDGGPFQIYAGISGVISNLYFQWEDQFIPGGSKILEIAPDDSELIAELFVANRDIALVKTGMGVKVKLDALSERTFGPVSGEVRDIAPDIVSGKDQATNGTYRVEVKLAQQSLKRAGTEIPFRAGMGLEGLIVTRHETLLNLAIEKLLKLKDAFLKD